MTRRPSSSSSPLRRPSGDRTPPPGRTEHRGPTRTSRRFIPIDARDLSWPLRLSAGAASGSGTIDLGSATPLPDEPMPERIDRYTIRAVLGRGGMASVYRAFDPLRGHDVALKVLRGGLSDARRTARFRQEAALALTLAHPSFIRAFEGGSLMTGPALDGRVFYAMEIAEGPTLAEVLEREGRLPAVHAAQLVRCLARAIDHLHERGVVHRDLKPANVVLHPVRGPLVLDLGLAKDLGARRNLTATGEILGTVSYMSPEQVQGTAVDRRTDVYALGAILYTLLTGRCPHPGPPVVALRRILQVDPTPPRRLVPDLPAALEAVVLTALARDPAGRFSGAGALAGALEALVGTAGGGPCAADPLESIAPRAEGVA